VALLSSILSKAKNLLFALALACSLPWHRERSEGNPAVGLLSSILSKARNLVFALFLSLPVLWLVTLSEAKHPLPY